MALQGSVAGNLVATASAGGITDSAVLDITGTSSFTDTADAGINLGDLQSNGAVTVDGGATTIVNDSALALHRNCNNLVATAMLVESPTVALDITGTSSFTDTADAGINLGDLQSNGAVTVDGGATTIVNDSALALQGSVAGNLVATAVLVESPTAMCLMSPELPVSPTLPTPESILVTCSQTEQLPWMVERPRS